MKKAVNPKNKRKIKNKYDSHIAPRLEEVKAWARDGVTEEEIAKRLGVAYSTLREHKKTHSALSDALKCARAYDDEVVFSLHRNTLGGIVKLKKPIKLRRTIFEDGKKVREEEYIEYADEEEYIKPDTMAQMYWLNNRRPEEWRAKPEEKKGAGEGGGDPSELKIIVERRVVDLSKGEEDAENQLQPDNTETV